MFNRLKQTKHEAQRLAHSGQLRACESEIGSDHQLRTWDRSRLHRVYQQEEQ